MFVEMGDSQLSIRESSFDEFPVFSSFRVMLSSFFSNVSVVVKLEGGTDEEVAALQNEKIDDESVLELKKMKRCV